MDFHGAKAAVMIGEDLLVFLRDNKPGLRFANMWDFPGGGREGNESPFECLQREVEEEFGLQIQSSQVKWQKEYPAMHDPNERAFFFVISLSSETTSHIKFGSEGQRWQLMSVAEFLEREDAVPLLKGRLRDYLEQRK